MSDIRGMAKVFRGERLRVLELAAVVFLWQAAVGVYLLSLVQQYLPQELHTGRAYPGYAMACYGVAKFLWQPGAGWIADRFGRRVTMVAGIAISLPVLALMMEVPDERAFLALSGLLGLGAATMWPAFMAHVGETTPHARRGRTMALVNIAQMGGLGAGTFLGVMMVDFVTYGAAFWTSIGFTMLTLVVVWRRIDPARAGHAVVPTETRTPSRAATAGVWTPGIAVLAVIVLFLTLGTSMHTPMIGAYTHDVLRVKMSFLAMLLPAPALVGGVAFWKFGHLTDHFGRQVPLIAGLAVASLSIFALTLTTSPFIVVNLVVLAGLAYAISIPAWGAAALDATDVGSRGLWLGALSAVQGLGAAGGQALGGAVGGAFGPLAPFKIAALLLMVALAMTLAHQALQARQRRAAAAVVVPVRIAR